MKADKTHVPEIPGVVKQTWSDVSNTKTLLGYDLNKGMQKFVEWYKQSNKN